MKNIEEVVKEILTELHADIDFDTDKRFVDDKVLDSFDLITLATELGEKFDVHITAKDFVADNFNSVCGLTKMIERLMKE